LSLDQPETMFLSQDDPEQKRAANDSIFNAVKKHQNRIFDFNGI
jgi:hypothetical protein